MDSVRIMLNACDGSLMVSTRILSKMSYFQCQLDNWSNNEFAPVLDAGLISKDQLLNICQMLDTPVLVKPLESIDWENACEMFGIKPANLPEKYFAPNSKKTKEETINGLKEFINLQIKDEIRAIEIYVPAGISYFEAKDIAIECGHGKYYLKSTNRPSKKKGKVETNQGRFYLMKA